MTTKPEITLLSIACKVAQLTELVEHLKEQNKVMRSALQFYADPGRYKKEGYWIFDVNTILPSYPKMPMSLPYRPWCIAEAALHQIYQGKIIDEFV